ncbi:MAG: hypothetical protein IT381_14295 [Deltaproteobacteria bacterium]|nr:hypothetical protein [Deltaproteobacteria bacterium]
MSTDGPVGSEERAALTHKPPKEELIAYVLRFPALKSGVCYRFGFVVDEKNKLPADAVVKEVCTKPPAVWEAPRREPYSSSLLAFTRR